LIWQITNRLTLGDSAAGRLYRRDGNNADQYITVNAAWDLDVRAHIHIGFVDNSGNDGWRIRVLVDAIVLSLSIFADRPMLVYCHEGRSRSVGILACVLPRRKRCTFDEAVALIRKQRTDININNGWRADLKAAMPEMF